MVKRAFTWLVWKLAIDWDTIMKLAGDLRKGGGLCLGTGVIAIFLPQTEAALGSFGAWALCALGLFLWFNGIVLTEVANRRRVAQSTE